MRTSHYWIQPHLLASVRQKFSKVSTLLDLLCKMTVELTFEKFLCVDTCHLQAEEEKEGGKIYVYINIYIYIYMNTYIYMYICICMNIYVYIYINMYIKMYV